MENATSMRRITLAAAAALGGVLCASSAQAITIYAADNLGTTNVGSIGDRIIRFDSANPAGTVVTVGSTGVANRGFSGLDFAGNGNLYGGTGFNSDGSAFAGSQLYQINPNTGAGVLVGSMNLPQGVACTDMSWNPVTQQMLMIGNQGTATNNLYTINLGTGAATLVGAISGITGGLDIGLASNSAGVNYVHDIVGDRMYVLAGLVATPLPSPIGVDTNFSQGMVINHQGANEWFLGAIGSSPTLFSQVMQINNATGAGTTVPNGAWPLHSNGLPEYETGDLAIPVVPEPTGAMLFVAGGLAAALKRRRAH
jgi:hypothetical protein